MLAYAMEYSETMEKLICAEQSAGKRVLLLCGGKSANKLPGEKLQNVGPGEFLRYIGKAELVITNSFHGSALSIIFEKPFYCVSHSSRNARLESLLQNTGQPEKLLPVSDSPETPSAVDSIKAAHCLESMIEESKKYLSHAILVK